jgi:hypothetical protein
MHAVEPFVSEPTSFEVESALKKLKLFKSLGTDQSPKEVIQAGGNTLHSEIHKLTNSVWNKKELTQQ